jgi:hypothetical protein
MGPTSLLRPREKKSIRSKDARITDMKLGLDSDGWHEEEVEEDAPTSRASSQTPRLVQSFPSWRPTP